MTESLAIRHARARDGSRAYTLLLGALLGLVAAALGLALLASADDLLRMAREGMAASEEVVAEPPARELSREWRWSPEALEYEHMYRKQETPRLDWIREGGRR